MGSEKATPEEARKFIQFIQSLSIHEQAGILQIIQGARLIAESQKKKQ